LDETKTPDPFITHLSHLSLIVGVDHAIGESDFHYCRHVDVLGSRPGQYCARHWGKRVDIGLATGLRPAGPANEFAGLLGMVASIVGARYLCHDVGTYHMRRPAARETLAVLCVVAVDAFGSCPDRRTHVSLPAAALDAVCKRVRFRIAFLRERRRAGSVVAAG
jgi:hypothetical protein